MDQDWRAFGDAVRQRREDLGLTQEQAAANADVSTATWRIVETASRTNVRRSALRAICRTLGWSADSYELLTVGQQARLPAISATSAVTGRGVKDAPQALDGKFAKLTPAQRAKIEALVDEMLPPEEAP